MPVICPALPKREARSPAFNPDRQSFPCRSGAVGKVAQGRSVSDQAERVVQIRGVQRLGLRLGALGGTVPRPSHTTPPRLPFNPASKEPDMAQVELTIRKNGSTLV